MLAIWNYLVGARACSALALWRNECKNQPFCVNVHLSVVGNAKRVRVFCFGLLAVRKAKAVFHFFDRRFGEVDRVPCASTVQRIARTPQIVHFFARLFDCFENNCIDRVFIPLLHNLSLCDARRVFWRAILAHACYIRIVNQLRKRIEPVRLVVDLPACLILIAPHIFVENVLQIARRQVEAFKIVVKRMTGQQRLDAASHKVERIHSQWSGLRRCRRRGVLVHKVCLLFWCAHRFFCARGATEKSANKQKRANAFMRTSGPPNLFICVLKIGTR